MSGLVFERERFDAEFLDPRRAFEPTRTTVEARRDPLTGQSARILQPGSFPAPTRHDLESLALATRDECPFCLGRIEQQTPRFPAEVWPDGRIRVGEAVAFPNLVPYAKWSSVSVYSPRRHLLRLPELTPELIADNLAAQRDFGRAVLAHDPSSSWITVNANHLPPAGSSVFHPHLQGGANPRPTTLQRLLAEAGPDKLRAYVRAERDAGERFVSSHDGVDWVASFAPLGPAEFLAFVDGVGSPPELSDGLIATLASGLAAVFRVHDELGFQSFNLALYGIPAGEVLVARVLARAYFGAAERSDAMWSERAQWVCATDLAPERVAELARAVF